MITISEILKDSEYSPLELTALNLKHAPQSYMYIENPVEKMFQKVSMG